MNRQTFGHVFEVGEENCLRVVKKVQLIAREMGIEVTYRICEYESYEGYELVVLDPTEEEVETMRAVLRLYEARRISFEEADRQLGLGIN